MRDKVILICFGTACVAGITIAALLLGYDHAIAVGGTAAVVELINMAWHRKK